MACIWPSPNMKALAQTIRLSRDGEHASCMLSRNCTSHHRANLSARRIAQMGGAVVKNLVSGESQIEAYVAR